MLVCRCAYVSVCVVLIITEEREVINLRNGHRSKVRVGGGEGGVEII